MRNVACFAACQQSRLRSESVFPTVLINMMAAALKEIPQFKMSREYISGAAKAVWEWKEGFISTIFKWVWVKRGKMMMLY